MNAMEPSEGGRRLCCALCVIECGMRLHGNYKEVVIIIRFFKRCVWVIRPHILCGASRVWDGPGTGPWMNCGGGVIPWMEGRLLPYRFRPAGSCRRFPLLVWYPALLVFLFPTLLIGDRHQIFNSIKPLAKFLWSRRVHLSDEHIQKSNPCARYEDVWRNGVLAPPLLNRCTRCGLEARFTPWHYSRGTVPSVLIEWEAGQGPDISEKRKI